CAGMHVRCRGAPSGLPSLWQVESTFHPGCAGTEAYWVQVHRLAGITASARDVQLPLTMRGMYRFPDQNVPEKRKNYYLQKAMPQQVWYRYPRRKLFVSIRPSSAPAAHRVQVLADVNARQAEIG